MLEAKTRTQDSPSKEGTLIISLQRHVPSCLISFCFHGSSILICNDAGSTEKSDISGQFSPVADARGSGPSQPAGGSAVSGRAADGIFVPHKMVAGACAPVALP